MPRLHLCPLNDRGTEDRKEWSAEEDGLCDSFGRLDSRISSVEQTAAIIGDHLQMKESKDGSKSDTVAKSSSIGSLPLILDIDDFKGKWTQIFLGEETDSLEGHGNLSGNDALPNGNLQVPSDVAKSAEGVSTPLFPEVDALFFLFKNSCKELVDLRQQGKKLSTLIKINAYGFHQLRSKHIMEKGVDGLFDSFARLDSRISSVGQTAAKIGDHLQVN
ncbi:hypothetical protein NE237_028112 [Protea cynaroides]|uniref:Exocyst complex component Sec10 N-terminal domain-containing protein n=1 Tax=Protea cynaroides TaxID=273540 RepID=A0A9Q0GRS3_9MAGN|nr:hypothetical protein NE237_028112 [Protea cynaroides]